MTESVERLAREAVLKQVADTYKQAVLDGQPPIKAVTDSLGLPRGTAIRRIRQSREAGLIAAGLGPTHSKKLVAVARALNVEPSDLHAAILTHAAGDLRVS